VSFESLWFDWSIDLWPLVMGGLVAVTCGLLGTVFLVRRTALLGDAVSHSVLPGVAGGLLAAGLLTRGDTEGHAFGASVAMLFVVAGALIAGTLSTALIEALHRYSRIKPDTALGAVFPAFFAAGVILIEVAARGAHFDLDCVFYGALESIDSFERVVPTLVATGLVVAFFACGYKEILITSFDDALARSLGLRVRVIQRVLIALLAVAVVAAFEAVGAILVVAFLVIPPATARLLDDRFHRVLLLAALCGASAAFFGAWLTIVLADEHIGLETLRAPSMAVVAGLQFFAAFLLAPRRGLLVVNARRRAMRRRIADENLLGAVYRLESAHESGVDLETAARALRYALGVVRASCRRAARCGEIAVEADGRVRLTAIGRARIEQIIRAHRLWESYMTAELGAAPDHVHDAADRIEHHLQPSLVRDLEALLGSPTRDPHGREIP